MIDLNGGDALRPWVVEWWLRRRPPLAARAARPSRLARPRHQQRGRPTWAGSCYIGRFPLSSTMRRHA